MKSKLILTLCSLLLAGLIGCESQQRQSASSSTLTPLPQEAAGTWKAMDSSWQITLNPNGTVASAIIPMGEVEVGPNQTTDVEMKDGSTSTYTAGDCTVLYTPATRELFITIEMKEIHVVFMDNRIDGNSTDRFVGIVSEDGKTWVADHISLFDYGPRFPQDPNDTYTGQITFLKIEE